MGRVIKTTMILILGFISFMCVACNKKNNNISEEITLAKTVLREVEFENSEKVKLNQVDDGFVVDGEIESMSPAQVSAFGVEKVSHVVVFKCLFDKERTIDYFKIKGDTVKVYSTDKNDEGYVGSISNLLDNDASEDAFCYLILSANTKEYEIMSKYTDGVESNFKIKIEATLSETKSE